MVNSPCFFQVESDLRSSARNRQILLTPAYKEATSNLAQTSFVHAGSTAPQVRACRMPFKLSAHSLLHLAHAKWAPAHWSHWTFSYTETGSFVQQRPPRFLPALNIQIRRFPLQLPPFVWSFSSYTQSQNFHLIMKKLTIQIRHIARSRHRNLKKTCQHGQGRFQILACFVFVAWSILAGFPESCFLKIISHL